MAPVRQLSPTSTPKTARAMTSASPKPTMRCMERLLPPIVFQPSLGVQALGVAEDGRQRHQLGAGEEAHRAVARLGVAVELDAVPTGAVPDVVDADVVVLAPEERHVL